MLESPISPEAGSGVALLSQSVIKRRRMKRSISEGDLSSSKRKKKKAKHHEFEDLESDLAPRPIRCSISDGDLIKRKETDTDDDAEYPNDVVNLESAMVNTPSMRSNEDKDPPNPTPRVFNLNFSIIKPDPKVYVDEAWQLLKPALTSILKDEDLGHFSFAEIYKASSSCFENKAGEPFYKLIVEECGAYISTNLQSLVVHCNDDDPSLLLHLLEKSWLDFNEKFRLISSIAAVEGRIRIAERKTWALGFELFPTKLFLATQVRDKVRTSILLLITDKRLGKSVNMSQLKNLMDMFNGSIFRDLRFLEKPFLDSTAEFYAAEAKQVLEHSDLPQYLKHVDQRVGEENKNRRSLPLFSIFRDKLLEVVNRELLGVHACAILEKGFEKLMDERPMEDLCRMYELFSQADLVGHINDALSSYICKTGENILKEGSSLAAFKAHVDKICFSYFLEDPLLEKTVQKCFEGLGMSAVPHMLDDDPIPEVILELES